MNGLTIERLVVRHEGRVLVDVADLTAAPGQPLTIVGESGSGKSLLAHAVMGTIASELEVTGALTVGSTRFDLAARDARRAAWGRELALLPQEPMLALDPTMRVRDQVAEGALGQAPRDRRSAALADTALARLGLGDAARAFPHTLSGGMAQRVAYAATTLGGARVLIVDEPSKGLDAAAVDRLAQLLADHVAGDAVLLTITHDLRLARSLGGEVLVMRDASVVEQGPAATVLQEPRHDYTRRLLAAEPRHWRFPWQRATAPSATGEPVLAATALSKSYGDRTLFEEVGLTVRPGERWAISGPSGVGKTTLGNVLLRLTRPDAGTVRHGPSLSPGRVQKLYQEPALSFPRRVALGTAIGDVLRRHDVPIARFEALLERVGIPVELLQRRPGQVSGGELQRLQIVRAMVVAPGLLLADEATSRLDLVTQETTADCLMTELSGTDCALLLVTHDEDLIDAVADHRLRLGEVVSLR